MFFCKNRRVYPQSLLDIVGEGYAIKELKPLFKRIINRRVRPEKRQLWVQLMAASDGGKFKILRADVKYNAQIKYLQNLVKYFDSLDFVPQIIWSDETMIVLKYIDGSFPDFSSIQFSKEFGKNLAILHNTNVGTADKDEYLERIFKNLNYLYSEGAISQSIKDRCYNEIISIKPRELRTSMTYSNMHNEKNFIIDKNGKLWFIDLGSFKESRVTDDALFGYKLFKNIDRRVFWESYFENGGTEYLKENEKFLRITQLVRKGAWHLKKSYDLSFFYLRSKRSRLNKAKWMVSELVGEIDRVDN